MAKKQSQRLPHFTGKETEARAASSEAGAGAQGDGAQSQGSPQ